MTVRGIAARPDRKCQGLNIAQLSPAEFEALRRIQTLDPADERLVHPSRHVRGLIEVSGTEDDLRSLNPRTANCSPGSLSGQHQKHAFANPASNKVSR